MHGDSSSLLLAQKPNLLQSLTKIVTLTKIRLIRSESEQFESTRKELCIAIIRL